MNPPDFRPVRCPNRRCVAFRDPPPRFWRRNGTYRPRCRKEPIPRFRCKLCRRGFSRQTFRLDYRDKRPELNVELFKLLTSGVGLRQAGRCLELDVHAVQKKFRKLARHMRLLNRSLLRRLPPGRVLLLDELESFEHTSVAPLTVPVLIDRTSKLVLATDVAPIRRAARYGSPRRQRLERFEAKHGRRRDRGFASVRRVFGRLADLLRERPATLATDEKTTYARQCRQRFGPQVVHCTVSSKRPRTGSNPLAAINMTDAMLRDNNGRLRRRSWLVSKRGRYLRLQLELFTAYRNWHRRRHNDDPAQYTAGVAIGFCRRRLEVEELLAWRQDWRSRAIHPASVEGQATVGQDVA